MCGIVGYIGDKNAVEIILEGLKRLEYRGYDSAGVAVLGPEGLEVRRAAGRIKGLEGLLRERPVGGLASASATRAGPPTAVPPTRTPIRTPTARASSWSSTTGSSRTTCPSRSAWSAEGHVFRSETDTEVIAHLIERHLRDTPRLDEATRRALRELRGSYAVVVLSTRAPDRLVAAKHGAGSVVVGLGAGRDLPRLGHPGHPRRTRATW